MEKGANNALKRTFNANDGSKNVSTSKLLAGDNSELLKYIMLVKPGYVESLLEERGLVLKDKDDYLALPKIMELGLDRKGIEGSKGFITFDLRSLLVSAPVSKDEIRLAQITYTE